MNKEKTDMINYALIIIGTLLLYYGYLIETSRNLTKIGIPLAAGSALLLFGLVRLK